MLFLLRSKYGVPLENCDCSSFGVFLYCDFETNAAAAPAAPAATVYTSSTPSFL